MKDRVRRLFFWIFVAPLIELLLAPAFALLQPAFSSIPHSYREAFDWSVRVALFASAPCSGALCMWCWFNWKDDESLARAGVFLVGAFWLLASLLFVFSRSGFND
jgi:hypothetical protein